jgi:GNAT acetyltransferase-like protein
MSADNRDNPIETERLLLRRPQNVDADAIFRRYSSDPDMTRYLGWPRHHAVDEVLAFIKFSDAHWEQWSCGPYLIERTSDRQLLGGTGLACDGAQRASTGYVTFVQVICQNSSPHLEWTDDATHRRSTPSAWFERSPRLSHRARLHGHVRDVWARR